MVLLAGCGGGASGDPDAGSSTASLSTPAAFCSEWVKLGSASDAFCLGGRVDDFLPDSLAFCRTLDGLLTKGTITYAAGKAAACLAQRRAIPASTCSWSVPCYSEVITGQVAAGTSCAPGECAPGLLCALPNPRSCGPMICRRDPGEGESCETLFCAAGLTCAGGVCTKDQQAIGERCDPSFDTCEFGSTCFPIPGETLGVCRAGKEGSPCTDDSDCPYVENFCDGTTCRPRRTVGTSCADHPEGCVFLARCDEKTKVCVRAAVENEACGMLGFCLVGGCHGLADPESSVCVANLALGAACDSSRQCASGTCTDGVCVGCTP